MKYAPMRRKAAAAALQPPGLVNAPLEAAIPITIDNKNQRAPQTIGLMATAPRSGPGPPGPLAQSGIRRIESARTPISRRLLNIVIAHAPRDSVPEAAGFRRR